MADASNKVLERFAVCNSETGEIYDVGLRRRPAEAFAASYNASSAGSKAIIVPIVWRLAPQAIPERSSI